MRVDGDFVECGVGKGFLASAIMDALDWRDAGRHFWLMDTFSGVDESQVSALEAGAYQAIERNRRQLSEGFYATDAQAVARNFSKWGHATVIVGPIPATLPLCKAPRIAFLHIDMNCAAPEVVALREFWPRLSRGAVVLLDDDAYAGFAPQKLAIDALAGELGAPVLALPTGQGMIVA